MWLSVPFSDGKKLVRRAEKSSSESCSTAARRRWLAQAFWYAILTDRGADAQRECHRLV
jgi:hypothetical protein